jgi:nitroimidazol reductase NimA-like FMN-containing flavoprotein (pyridoxamine 5'-phosphate oxidase superfamily)
MPDHDSGGLEILTPVECLKLLATAPLGRIAFTNDALPAIQPVNFILDEGEVIILTSAGSKLAAAARQTVVAFEADDFDPTRHTGWSVVIVGQARVVTGDEELARLRSLPLQPWAPARRDRYIAITPRLTSGRRIPSR